jgi:hypothetical protein
MGYTTEFDGSVIISPPLNAHEIAYLRKFAASRRMDRARGPYFVDGSGPFGQGHDDDIRTRRAAARPHPHASHCLPRRVRNRDGEGHPGRRHPRGGLQDHRAWIDRNLGRRIETDLASGTELREPPWLENAILEVGRREKRDQGIVPGRRRILVNGPDTLAGVIGCSLK